MYFCCGGDRGVLCGTTDLQSILIWKIDLAKVFAIPGSIDDEAPGSLRQMYKSTT